MCDSRIDRNFDTYLFTLKLSFSFPSSSFNAPLCIFILCAVCHVLVITSPILPIACESELIILNTPHVMQNIFCSNCFGDEYDYPQMKHLPERIYPNDDKPSTYPNVHQWYSLYKAVLD